MAQTKKKIESTPLEKLYREGSLGWFLIQAGYEPVAEWQCQECGMTQPRVDRKMQKCINEQCKCQFEEAHPLWRKGADDERRLTGWQARREVLLRIRQDFENGMPVQEWRQMKAEASA